MILYQFLKKQYIAFTEEEVSNSTILALLLNYIEFKNSGNIV